MGDDVERVWTELTVGECGDVVHALITDENSATVDVGEPEIPCGPWLAERGPWNHLAVTIRIECLSVDAHDPSAQARWWSEALGWRITEEDGDEGGHRSRRRAPTPGFSEILFVTVPEDKAVKNRLHLDLRPDDQAAEVARFEQLGARHVDVGQTPEHTWVVLADPEGNEFCILRAQAT